MENKEINAHEKLIRSFYTAFQNKDWKGMQACYHNDIVFSDPVFQNLKGGEAKAMWHMLISSARDLTIQFNSVQAANNFGSCHWEAHYSFSRTGRKVHNIIDARFKFKDSLIVHHSDTFNLWKWSKMALGMSGTLLGWSPIVRNKIRGSARSGLNKFIADHQQYR
jgi:ketosteroid isomerase-like protein